MTKVLVEGVIPTTLILFLGHIIQNTEMRHTVCFLVLQKALYMECIVLWVLFSDLLNLLITPSHNTKKLSDLLPMCLASPTYKNPQRCKIIHGMPPEGHKDRLTDLNMCIVEISDPFM